MITFTADGKDYKLEVTAFTLKQMEKNGVTFEAIKELYTESTRSRIHVPPRSVLELE